MEQTQDFSFRGVLKQAFLHSLPVLMGYFTMGFAAGVLLAVHGGIRFAPFWAFVTSATSISGALQFMMAEWIRTGTPLRDVAVLTFCLNVRYALYGFSLLEHFRGISLWKKLYLIWAMTDETFALEVESKLPKGPVHQRYCLLLAMMDHLYWIIGVTSGAAAGAALPFDCKGIDFAMTALFLVILTDQCRERGNRIPAAVGGGCAFLSFLAFGAGRMLIPAMVLMLALFILFRRQLSGKEKSA